MRNDIYAFRSRLVLLKHLDSVIDFSRATNQLELILFLYSARRPVSIDEIASTLGYSKKAVLDSLRKLERKELVIKEKDEKEVVVSLSSKGTDFVSKIFELLKPITAMESALAVSVRLNLAKEVLTGVNLYKVIVYAGLVKPGYPVTVNEIEKALGITKNELEVLLNSFTQPPAKLFKIIRTNEKEAIMLDKQGLEILKRTAHYKAYVTSKLYRNLVKLIRTPWMAEIIAKINMLMLLIIICSTSLMLILNVPVLVMILVVGVLLAFTTVVNMYLYSYKMF